MNVAALLGVAHCIVDFSCALTVVSLFFFGSPAPGEYYQWVIVYNLMAFAGQPFWGWLLDRGRGYRLGIFAGFCCIGLGPLVVGVGPLPAVVFLGCGNALFHVGAGALVYSDNEGRAGAPGLFVAPGGLGLFVGMFLAPLQLLSPLWVLPLLAVTAWVFHHFVPAVAVQEMRVMKGEQKSLLPAMLKELGYRMDVIWPRICYLFVLTSIGCSCPATQTTSSPTMVYSRRGFILSRSRSQ